MSEQTTGANATAAGTAGAGSPPVNTGQAGVATGAATAAAAQVAGNQSTQQAGAGQPQAGGQTVPLAVVTQLREKNRQLEALVLEAREQNAAVMQRLEQIGAGRTVPDATAGEEGIAPADLPILNALEKRISKQFGPLLERFGSMANTVEMQEKAARIERQQKAWATITEKNPIYAHKLLGAGAKAELQAKMAQYETMRIPVNAFEVAEEVAAKWNATKAEYDAEVAGGLVRDARAAAPGAGTGAAVTTGMGGGQVQPQGQGFVGIRAKSEQFKQELLRQRAAGAGAA